MLRSVSLIALLTIVWGFNWSVMKIGATELPPLWFRTLSLCAGTAILGAVLVLRGTSLRLPPRGLRWIVLASIPNIVVWYALVTVAVTCLPAGRAAILGFTMPAWTALIAIVVYRERLDRWTFVGIVCAIAGVALMLAGEWSTMVTHPVGVAMMLVAAACWGWGTHVVKRLPLRIDTLVLTFWMMLVACPFLIAGSATFEWRRWRIPSGVEWWPIAYNAILVLAIGNLIWFTTARRLTPTAAALSSMLIPVVGVFSGIVMLHEAPGWRDDVALALVSVAVVAALAPRAGASPVEGDRASNATPAWLRPWRRP